MKVDTPPTAPPGIRWWKVMTQAQKTGRCPFCGAALPRQTFYSWSGGVRVPMRQGYTTICPQCLQSSFPLSVQSGILLAVLAWTVAVLALWLLFGVTVFGLALVASLVLAFIPLIAWTLRHGQYFNTLCFVVGVGFFGTVVLRSLAIPWPWLPSYSVSVAASVPQTERIGRPVSASLLIRNTGSSLDEVDIDTGAAASALDPNLASAAWQLDGISVNSHRLALSKDPLYDAGSLAHGGTMHVVLRLTPRLRGSHRFYVGVDRYIDCDPTKCDPNPTLRGVTATTVVAGRARRAIPAPSYAIRATASLSTSQRVGRPVHMLLTVHNKGSAISHLWMVLAGTLTVDSPFWSYTKDQGWAIQQIMVNARSLTPGDDGRYDFGPLAPRQDVPATILLVPRRTGTRQLQVSFYRDQIDSDLELGTIHLSASIAP